MGGRSRFDADFPDSPSPWDSRAPEPAFRPGVPRLPFRLYVDNRTLVEPLHDLRDLRRGDHCMVGLNPFRKVSAVVDATFTWLASWEIYPLYHHFVVVDDVASVDARGVPLRADGRPAMICEYSNTPAAAIRQLQELGISHVWRNLAQFHKLPLHDYSDSRRAHGILRVVRHCPDAHRDEIVRRVEGLLGNAESYSIWFRNCEHAAFSTTISRIMSGGELASMGASLPSPRPGSRVWESPQVPHVLCTLGRFALQLVGAGVLSQVSALCCEVALLWPCLDPSLGDRGPFVAPFVAYHTFATLPVALQVAVQLGLAVRTLTRTRRKGRLPRRMYRHLLGKEVARAVIVGACATAVIGTLPRTSRALRLPAHASAALLVLAFMASSLLYSLTSAAAIRVIARRRGSGVFFDADHAHVGARGGEGADGHGALLGRAQPGAGVCAFSAPGTMHGSASSPLAARRQATVPVIDVHGRDARAGAHATERLPFLRTSKTMRAGCVGA